MLCSVQGFSVYNLFVYNKHFEGIQNVGMINYSDKLGNNKNNKYTLICKIMFYIK